MRRAERTLRSRVVVRDRVRALGAVVTAAALVALGAASRDALTLVLTWSIAGIDLWASLVPIVVIDRERVLVRNRLGRTDLRRAEVINVSAEPRLVLVTTRGPVPVLGPPVVNLRLRASRRRRHRRRLLRALAIEPRPAWPPAPRDRAGRPPGDDRAS